MSWDQPSQWRTVGYIDAPGAPWPGAKRSLSIKNHKAATDLLRLLDGAAERIETVGPEPNFVGECPNKFNDAWYDDLWFAVQAGETYWEQSQFFEGRSGPLVKEHATFSTDGDEEAVRAEWATVTSGRIAALRGLLRDLQTSGWRELTERAFTEKRELLGLMIEHGQRWLALETPNVDDCEIFAWDAKGMFHVGTTSRIDQAIGQPYLLTFEDIVQENLSRLGQRARAYFRPFVKDNESALRLTELLREVVRIVRAATDRPVAMRSRDSLHPAYSPPESFSEVLRQGEGQLRKPTDGKWPPYCLPYTHEPKGEFSDEAKAFHTALGQLEDEGWRDLYGQAFGETLHRGQALALFVDPDAAVLMRENAAFRVDENGLDPLGAFPYPDCRKPEDAPALKAARA